MMGPVFLVVFLLGIVITIVVAVIVIAIVWFCVRRIIRGIRSADDRRQIVFILPLTVVLAAVYVVVATRYMGLRGIVSPPGMGRSDVTWSDPRVIPLLAAMDKADRASKGFLPIPRQDSLEIIEPAGPIDVEFRSHGTVPHDIGFRRTPSGLKWISETETFTGPKQYRNAHDELFSESIVVEYTTERLFGYSSEIGQPSAFYSGDNSRLQRIQSRSDSYDLTLRDVAPVLKMWNFELPEPSLRASRIRSGAK